MALKRKIKHRKLTLLWRKIYKISGFPTSKNWSRVCILICIKIESRIRISIKTMPIHSNVYVMFTSDFLSVCAGGLRARYRFGSSSSRKFCRVFCYRVRPKFVLLIVVEDAEHHPRGILRRGPGDISDYHPSVTDSEHMLSWVRRVMKGA